jgi:DivIVA domain-containing protein
MRFPRRLWWAPGYEVSAVDAFVERIEATLGNVAWSGQAVTAADVRKAKFRTTWRQGYDEEMVDKALDSYALRLD